MKPYPFSQVRFLQSALAQDSIPDFFDERKIPYPEMAIVGRSNVGKSSLINHLFNQKKLAKVSSTPGKTQTLNFFFVDEKLILVDLPGYGYAKVSKEKKDKWAEHLDIYLQTRSSLKVLLILLDSRHPPTEEDKTIIEWAHQNGKTLLFIFTKCDELKPLEIEVNITSNLKTIIGIVGERTLMYLNYTIKDGKCRKALIDQVNQAITKTI